MLKKPLYRKVNTRARGVHHKLLNLDRNTKDTLDVKNLMPVINPFTKSLYISTVSDKIIIV